MKNPKKFYQRVLQEIDAIINASISEREKFARLNTFINTASTYHAQYSMHYMNFGDLDLTMYQTEKVGFLDPAN